MQITSILKKMLSTFAIALAGTGFIWVRYSLVITPVNYSLAAVSLFKSEFQALFE